MSGDFDFNTIGVYFHRAGQPRVRRFDFVCCLSPESFSDSATTFARITLRFRANLSMSRSKQDPSEHPLFFGWTISRND